MVAAILAVLRTMRTRTARAFTTRDGWGSLAVGLDHQNLAIILRWRGLLEKRACCLAQRIDHPQHGARARHPFAELRERRACGREGLLGAEARDVGDDAEAEARAEAQLWLRWFDADGHVLPAPEEDAKSLATAVEQEKARVDDAERRIAELEKPASCPF